MKRKYFRQNGWIDRKGKFYGCEFSGHMRRLQKVGINSEQVERYGWIKICNNDYTGEYDLYCFGKPTQAQINTFYDWCKNKKTKYAWNKFKEEHLDLGDIKIKKYKGCKHIICKTCVHYQKFLTVSTMQTICWNRGCEYKEKL